MKQIDRIKSILSGLARTLTRFPLTVIFLIAATILNAVVISTSNEKYHKQLFLTFLIGASIYLVLQLTLEHFIKNKKVRPLAMMATLTISIIYYLIVYNTEFDIEVGIRTLVFLFMLLVAYLWIPSIQSKTTFNDTFMAAFRAFFMVVVYSGVLFLGIALILGAVDMLIIRISGDYFLQAANLVFILYAPLHYLSLVHYCTK